MRRKWKQKKLAVAAMMIFAFSSVPAVPAQAAGSYETQVTSEVQLGAVNIMLTETQMNPEKRSEHPMDGW